jgi:hypothetical protein
MTMTFRIKSVNNSTNSTALARPAAVTASASAASNPYKRGAVSDIVGVEGGKAARPKVRHPLLLATTG